MGADSIKENSRRRYIDRYDVYGTTVKRFFMRGRHEKRNFHIYYSDGKAYSEKLEIKQRIRRLKKYLDSCVGIECVPFGPEIRKYFHLNYEKDGKTLKLAEENTSAVEKELSLAGYFAIVSSDNMTAREVIELYKSRDASENCSVVTSPILEIKVCVYTVMKHCHQRYLSSLLP